jgi:hypothetical protein
VSWTGRTNPCHNIIKWQNQKKKRSFCPSIQQKQSEILLKHMLINFFFYFFSNVFHLTTSYFVFLPQSSMNFSNCKNSSYFLTEIFSPTDGNKIDSILIFSLFSVKHLNFIQIDEYAIFPGTVINPVKT